MYASAGADAGERVRARRALPARRAALHLPPPGAASATCSRVACARRSPIAAPGRAAGRWRSRSSRRRWTDLDGDARRRRADRVALLPERLIAKRSRTRQPAATSIGRGRRAGRFDSGERLEPVRAGRACVTRRSPTPPLKVFTLLPVVRGARGCRTRTCRAASRSRVSCFGPVGASDGRELRRGQTGGESRRARHRRRGGHTDAHAPVHVARPGRVARRTCRAVRPLLSTRILPRLEVAVADRGRGRGRRARGRCAGRVPRRWVPRSSKWPVPTSSSPSWRAWSCSSTPRRRSRRVRRARRIESWMWALGPSSFPVFWIRSTIRTQMAGVTRTFRFTLYTPSVTGYGPRGPRSR